MGWCFFFFLIGALLLQETSINTVETAALYSANVSAPINIFLTKYRERFSFVTFVYRCTADVLKYIKDSMKISYFKVTSTLCMFLFLSVCRMALACMTSLQKSHTESVASIRAHPWCDCNCNNNNWNVFLSYLLPFCSRWGAIK